MLSVLVSRFVFSRGIYFANSSGFSNYYAYKPAVALAGLDPSLVERPHYVDSDREMFLTKLLVGKDVTMNLDESPDKRAECLKLVIPPTDPITNKRYNTVTGTAGESKIWVVYENGRAYPEYLVRYYRGERDSQRTPFENESDARRESARVTGTVPSPVAILETAATDLETGMHEIISWEFMDHDNNWTRYIDDHQVTLERAFQECAVEMTSACSVVRIRAGKWEYAVDINSKVQTNITHHLKRQRDVRRRVEIDVARFS